MAHHSAAPRAGRRAARLPLVAVLGLTLALGACGGSTPTVAPDPKKAAAALDAGLRAQTDGDLQTAAEQYREALKFDAKNKYALYNLALVDAAQSNYGAAEEKYRVVLGIDPQYAPALFNLAILRKAQGDEQEAVSLYRRVIAATPKDAAAHMNLGLLLRAEGQKAEGDAEVRRAIALNPKLTDPAAARG